MVAQSPAPGARGQTFDAQMELEFRGVGFCGGRKTGEHGENPRSKERTNNKFNPHETASTEIEPGSQRWDWGERLSTAPSVLPSNMAHVFIYTNLTCYIAQNLILYKPRFNTCIGEVDDQNQYMTDKKESQFRTIL